MRPAGYHESNYAPARSLVAMGGSVTKEEASVPETKLEAKIIEAVLRREVKGRPISLNSVFLKFPKIEESFRKCRTTFQEFDEDKNGSIDLKELNFCFRKLGVNFTDEEINELFEACDLNEDMSINFNEFIVLLCLVYLLKEDPAFQHDKTVTGLPDLGLTFETIVDTFVFLDKNKDGYVSKSEMVAAIYENDSGERSSGRIAMKRFEEMDWDKNGKVNFKEFLFAFTHWVGIEDSEDDDGEEDA